MNQNKGWERRDLSFHTSLHLYFCSEKSHSTMTTTYVQKQWKQWNKLQLFSEHEVCHSRWWLEFWGLFSLLKALKRSIPRKTLSKFIPTIPNSASGSSTPLSNLEASQITLAVMRIWAANLAVMKVTQLRTHSILTIMLLASRNPAIRRTFLTCRKIECSCMIKVENIRHYLIIIKIQNLRRLLKFQRDFYILYLINSVSKKQHKLKEQNN